MKGWSIRWKITLWFSIAIILMTILTIFSELTLSGVVLQKGIQDQFIEIVENNVDEIEYYEIVENTDGDSDLYMEYKEGYLEIDDDFLDVVNHVYTALYEEPGTLLYGENPVAKAAEDKPFVNGTIQTIRCKGVRYYIYDHHLQGENLEELWLRGIVSEETGTQKIHFLARISLILLLALCFLAVIGGYWIAGNCLKPVKKIQAAVDSIREGDDLSKRIHIGKGNDDLHRLANTFDEMFDRMEKVFLQQKKFTSDASHELRTPVSVILSHCEYSLSEPQTREEYMEALQLIERQGQRMSTMINELLTVTRLEQKKTSIELEPLNFSQLVEAVCQDMALIREKEICLRSEIEKDIFIQGNKELLIQLLNNLIVNAYRYGKPNGHILVQLSRTEEQVRLSVSDDGIGMRAEELPQIWNRFYQADVSRGSQGSGLGLSIVKEIASLHQGSMSVESKPGEGSTFIFSLKINRF